MDHKVTVTTDVVIGAAGITREIYKGNAVKLAARNHPDTALAEMRRAVLMDELAKDENLCEMLAGRIHQLGHGVK